MAEEVKDFEFKRGNIKYDWAKYTDGRKWELRRGEDWDFGWRPGLPRTFRIRSLRSAATMYAHRNKIAVRTSIRDDDTFIIQALPGHDHTPEYIG